MPPLFGNNTLVHQTLNHIDAFNHFSDTDVAFDQSLIRNQSV